MMDIETAERIHNILIDRFGGAKGIKIPDLLESALARPFATFDGTDLYPEPIDKAAALFESLIINHPFQDGNKRISYVLMRLLLMASHLDIEATPDEKYDFVIAASKGEIRYDEIRKWLSDHVKPK